ncbi:hypothetical protein KKC47_03225 [Patescibacteria group bacterium]|nr:hypothetical protein [Patescibacteria group bacterium]
MISRPEREAIAELIPKLRPFTFRGEAEFVLGDGTALFVAGISRSDNRPGEQTGSVVVLTLSKIKPRPSLPETVTCVGAVILRRETPNEQRVHSSSENFGTANVIESVAFEMCNDQGRCVVFRTGDQNTFPAII